MKKNKIISIILSSVIIATMSSIAGQAKKHSNKNMIPNKINNILLANHNTNYSANACVINGNNKLVLTNKKGDIISYLSIGEMLKVQSVEGNKSLITVQETGAKGYIDNSNKLDINEGDINNVTRMNRKGYIINVSNKVNLRKGPSMYYPILKGLSNSTPIRITGKTGQWYRVSVNGEKGYIFEEYVGEKNSSQYTNSMNINSKNKGSVINSNTPTTANINKVDDNHTKTIIQRTSAVKPSSTVHVVNNDENLNNINSGLSNNNSGTSINKTSTYKNNTNDVHTTSNVNPALSGGSKVVPSTHKNNPSDIHTIPSNKSIKTTTDGTKNTLEHQIKTPDKSKKSTVVSNTGNNQNPRHVITQMSKLPNPELQSWETGFNTVENKMNACNDNGRFLMDIYTPQNPASGNGETVYVRFANTNEICSGQLFSLITPMGSTNSEYGYLYEIPLYYKNVYKGTLYYGVNTYGDIQNGGFIPVNSKNPIDLTLDSGYWSIPDTGNYSGFQDLCYFVNGVAQKGFQKIQGNIYYFGEDGQVYYGTHIINGKKYIFSEEGKLIEGVPPVRSISSLPNVELKKYGTSIWNKMNAKLANGDVINIYTPQNPMVISNEEQYSYIKFNNQKGDIIGSVISFSDNLSDLGALITNIKENGQNIAQLNFGKNANGGIEALYKNLQTNKVQKVIFKPGYENQV